MSWLDQLLAETNETICPSCLLVLKPNTQADLAGDNRPVPDLSPTCPRPAPAHEHLGRGQRDKPTCPHLLSPVKPAPVLVFEPLGTKGQKGQVPGRDQQPATPIQDPTLEALCLGLPIEEAQAMREERAGILEYLGGMSRPLAEARAGLPVRGPPRLRPSRFEIQKDHASARPFDGRPKAGDHLGIPGNSHPRATGLHPGGIDSSTSQPARRNSTD